MLVIILALQMLVASFGSPPQATSMSLVAADCKDSPSNVVTPVAPAFPKSAKVMHVINIVVVVRISASGHVSSTKVLQSSGLPAFDHAAVVAAAESKYRPAMHDCKAVSGAYLYHADYQPE